MRIRIKDDELARFFGVECEVKWIDGREYIGNPGEQFPLNQLVTSAWEKIVEPVEVFTARYAEVIPEGAHSSVRKARCKRLYEAGMRFVPDQEESDLLTAIDRSPSPTPRANVLAKVLWEQGWRKIE